MAKQTTSTLGSYLARLPRAQLSRPEVERLAEQVQRGRRAQADLVGEPATPAWRETPNPESTRALRCRITEGIAAEHTLIQANLPLAVSFARRYHFDQVHLDDLIQAANIGLIEAVRTFDPERGATFSTWATFPIRDAILDYLAEHQHALRLPRSTRDLLLAKRRQGTEQKDSPASRAATSARSLAEPIDETRELWELLVAGDNIADPVERGALKNDVRLLLSGLSPRHYSVIVERFGLDGCALGTLEQAASRGVTREAVRLQFNSAMVELREKAEERGLQSWLQD